jgi:hypothetical protein
MGPRQFGPQTYSGQRNARLRKLPASVKPPLAPGSPTCGPGLEQGQYVEANGQVINSTRTRFGSNFGANSFITSAGFSNYNSLQASLQHNEKYANFLIAYNSLEVNRQRLEHLRCHQCLRSRAQPSSVHL